MNNPVPAGQTYHHKFPLDDTFYGMDPEDSQFLKERTGIFDDSALKEHIMNVAKNGYVVRKCYCLSPISKDESEHRMSWFIRMEMTKFGRPIPVHSKVQLHEVKQVVESPTPLNLLTLGSD